MCGGHSGLSSNLQSATVIVGGGGGNLPCSAHQYAHGRDQVVPASAAGCSRERESLTGALNMAMTPLQRNEG